MEKLQILCQTQAQVTELEQQIQQRPQFQAQVVVTPPVYWE